MSTETIHLLLVDDHKIVRDGIKSLLVNVKNIKVKAEANDAAEAIRVLEKEHFDVAVLDIQMKGMNGIELAYHIKSKYPETQILALSMYDEEQFILNMIEAGAKGYILKNSGKDELIRAIEAVNNGKSYYSSSVADTLINEMLYPSKEDEKASIPVLTSREMDVLRLIVDEFTNKEIAENLNISIRTVDAHRRNLISKTGVRNTAGLVKYAIEQQLFQQDETD